MREFSNSVKTVVQFRFERLAQRATGVSPAVCQNSVSESASFRRLARSQMTMAPCRHSITFRSLSVLSTRVTVRLVVPNFSASSS